jgi:hypothetical protein
MKFNVMNLAMQQHISYLQASYAYMYLVDIDGDTLWDWYIASFPAGTNPVFRERTEHDCSCCRSFIRQWGGLVVIDSHNQLRSIWDFQSPEAGYQPVLDVLKTVVIQRPIRDALVVKEARLGTEHSRELLDSGEVLTWSHLHMNVPKSMRYTGNSSIAEVQGQLRTQMQTLHRALTELTPAAIAETLDLISQGSLYRGEQWAEQLRQFQALQRKFSVFSGQEALNFCWVASKTHAALTGLRNSSLGTLLVNLSDDMDLDTAVRKYEQVTAPANYQRPKALITQATLEKARATIAELGIESSLPHRFAHLEDITVNNVLFADRDASRRMQGGSILDQLTQEVTNRPRKFDKVEEVEWARFVQDILPTATGLEVLLEGRHAGNRVSLLAPVNPTAPRVFKWDNGFSWAYAGNVADSMKERVKAAGGNVEGVLRFSIQWNEDGQNPDDNDAHCHFPNGHIYFGSVQHYASKGELDVDIIRPRGVAVENITWPHLYCMPDGDYVFSVNCYADRGGRGGFRAQLEANGTVHNFNYPQNLRSCEYVQVVTVTKQGNEFTVKPAKGIQSASGAGREMWGLTCGTFQRVEAVMFSPNYWDDQHGIGHRHLMFMLEGCCSDERPNGFFNEYLRNELIPHRRVFEVIGSKMAVEPDDRQLSGLGFSVTKRDNVVVKVKGNVERIIKVTF